MLLMLLSDEELHRSASIALVFSFQKYFYNVNTIAQTADMGNNLDAAAIQFSVLKSQKSCNTPFIYLLPSKQIVIKTKKNLHNIRTGTVKHIMYYKMFLL